MINYKFCPQCKNKLNKVLPHYYCNECKTTIYINPKPTVCVFIVNDNKVLINKRAIPPKKNTYDIPGGFLEPGESPSQTAIREVKEETGLTIKLIAIIGAYKEKYDGCDLTNIYYVGEVIRGKPVARDDVKDLKWVRFDKIPKMGFESVNKAARDFQVWYKKVYLLKII